VKKLLRIPGTWGCLSAILGAVFAGLSGNVNAVAWAALAAAWAGISAGTDYIAKVDVRGPQALLLQSYEARVQKWIRVGRALARSETKWQWIARHAYDGHGRLATRHHATIDALAIEYDATHKVDTDAE
jgi:hypothetical protein